jgi:hypothetical protein
MERNVGWSLLCGWVALGAVVGAAFVPWFEWSYLDGTQTWRELSDVWGPPAWVSGLPYGSVDVPPPHQRAVDVAVGVYLGLYLLGLALWARLVWAISRMLGRRWSVLAIGVGSGAVSAGIVVTLGLTAYIAKKVSLYAALASSWRVVAELESFCVIGPAMLMAGVALGSVTILRQLRAQRR